jgi:CzcA family heavy metal efflux pump
MPIDVFPDLTAPTVTVITEAEGMAPQEVESLITFPIETALNGASKVRRVRSSTAVGISVVWVEFDWGTDIYAARQVVNEKLQLVASSLPAEARRPVMTPISSIMGEILFLALTSDKHSPMELRTTADWTIRRRLLAVPGVAQVTPIGGEEKQYQVWLNPASMGTRQVSMDETVQALSSSNKNASAGFMVSGGQEYLVRGLGRILDTSDIEDTVVAVRGGQPVLVRHIGDVAVGAAVKRGDGSFNGEPAVIIGIQKQPDANTLDLTRRLDKTLDEVQASLPEGMRIHRRIFRQADFIQVAIHNVVGALRDGTILVIVILMLFLASVRATGITLLAIPLSLVATVIALKTVGATINTMTLGGLTIAIGALVDDAVIVVENVVRRLKQAGVHGGANSRPAPTVILSATMEIMPSIVFATLIIALVFLPIFFLTGVEGSLMRPLGFAYIVALLASLAVAVAVTPALCCYWLPGSRSLRKEHDSWLVSRLKAVYGPALLAAMDRPKTVASAATALFAAAGFAGLFLGRAFLPEFNEGTLTISAVTLPGTSLPESNSLGRQVEKIMLSHPEVKAVARRTGRAELDEHAMGVESAELDVGLEMKGRSKKEFLAALRRSLSIVPGMNVIIGQPISHRIDHMLSGTRANLAIKLFGSDLYELRRIAEEIRRAIQPVPGLVDLSVEQQSDIPILKVRLDRKAMARFGLTSDSVSKTLEAAFLGKAVSQVLEGQNAFELVVRHRGGLETEPERVGDILIDAPMGLKIPLKAVAQVSRDRGPNTISRENVQRKIVVMANASDRPIGDVVKDVRKVIKGKVKLPEGYYVEYGGQFEAEQSASKTLTLLGFAVIVGIGMILGIAFRSLRDTVFIMLNLPLALIGGVAGVYAAGGVLSVASLVGFITLFGIATRNGVMLISHVHHLMESEGVTNFKEAIVRGCMERLSPILMTALCAGLALIPLALSGGKPGSEIQMPMAVVILWGLLSSTVLNMLVVPAVYYRVGRPRKTPPPSM